MRTYWKFSAAEQILFGQNTARQVGSELALMGLRSAFIVTDSNLIKAGVVDVVRASLSEAAIDSIIFEGGTPEPSTDIVSNAVAAARKTNVDVVIGIGGGSNIDVAKVVAAILTHGGTPFDYFGEDKVPGRTIPIIAVPTTAGTGSETTPVAVLEDVTQKLKLAVSSNYLLPRLAVIDPLLTVSCPAKVTAESGMDALTHAVEAYTLIEHFALPIPADMRVAFPGKNPLSDAHATRAIQLIGANLRTAVYQPHNVAAREAMSLAALMAGMAFANSGLSAVHALQYPVGALTHTSHGLGNAILLPAVCDYLLPAQTREFAEIADLLGECADGTSDRDAAMWAIEAIRQIKTDVGIPNGLSDIGVTADDIPAMAQSTLRYQRLIRCSPRPLNAEAFEWILRRAL
ncbi:MAG: iron-containing alcohol dehydrogenase [Chloroflexi bacterium]|nr:iron-containing alcohol dehydrogenase [Chloroflexota bacterium]